MLVFSIASFLVTESSAQVLDQISDAPANTNGWAIGDRNAQTVTVGVDGYLSKIELQIYQSDSIASGDQAVDIFGLTSLGAPDINALLGSVLIENSSIPTRAEMDNMFQFTAADFASQNLFFNAGDQFAIVPRRTNLSNWGAPPWMIWGGGGNNSSYDNGSVYLDGLSGWSRLNGAHGFRTFVVGAEVPAIIAGDCNEDGVVNFFDITPFIEILTAGDYLQQADIDGSGEVTFLDVGEFVVILNGLN